MKKVLVIGSGGREHALAKAFSRSSQVGQVYVAPGNPGMVLGDGEKLSLVPIQVTQIEDLLAFVQKEAIDLTFVGPEQALNLGIVDLFRQADLDIVGPSQAASQIESSKAFAKDLMVKAGVPTASYQVFKTGQAQAAKAYLSQLTPPYVIKDNGLAAGKGVIICPDLRQAQQEVEGRLSKEGGHLVIEAYLEGQEFSYFAFVNETHILPLTSARDYKRVGDHDQGPNTGGMGAFSPVPYVDQALEAQVLETIIQPVAQAMLDQGTPYSGVLYAGLMLTDQGPQVIEFNARFGDPETQIILPRIQTDFYDLCQAHLNQRAIEVQINPATSLGVVLASQGYPGDYASGMALDLSQANLSNICFAGVAAAENQPDQQAFIGDSQAFVSPLDEDRESKAKGLVAKGGRVLMVRAQGASLDQVRQTVYHELENIQADKTFYRKDIGTI